ncbi:MAG: succinate dehydrogenase assembly factor 2 [Gammaproteobacteria bacterium]|nr:succinate dehydrogenase assembly factor 2 [Gammaproteobacteria bacterium]
MDRSRLRWQCRRGMRELDVLLTAYLETHYDTAGESRKDAFRELLGLPDPELAGYLLAGERPDDDEVASVVAHIRGDARC